MNNEYYLLANRSVFKKEDLKLSIDDEICLLLQKKYSEYHLDAKDIEYSFKKMENLIDELYINKILYELIAKIDG